MMSATLVMAVGSEQPKMSSAASAHVEGSETSFAQSFGEQVGLPAKTTFTNDAGDVSRDLHGRKDVGLVQILDTPAAASTVVQANSVTSQRMATLDESTRAKTETAGVDKRVAEGESSIAKGDLPERGQSKPSIQMPEDGSKLAQKNIVAAEVLQPTVAEGKPVESSAVDGSELTSVVDGKGIGSSAALSNEAVAEESRTDDAALRDGAASADRPVQPRSAVEPTVQRETALAGDKPEGVFVKKSSKTEATPAGVKAPAKTTDTSESAKTWENVSAVSGMSSSTAVLAPPTAPSDARPNTSDVPASSFTGVSDSSTGKIAATVSPAGAATTGREEIQPRADKDAALSTSAVAPPAAGLETVMDKAAAPSMPGKDIEEKELGAVGTATALHAPTENDAVASGVMPGMSAGHVVTGNGTTTQSGGTVTHGTAPQPGLVEQDSSGVSVAEGAMSHRTLLATPTALEVGLSNGSQGWLKIRAEMTESGAVNASLSAATSAGQEMLHRELPALTAYLQEERVAVNAVVVPASPVAAADSRFAGAMERDAGEHAQQSSGQQGGDPRRGPVPASSDRADELSIFMGSNGVGGDGVYTAATYASGGGWLNVRV
jgi:hypothetical protein